MFEHKQNKIIFTTFFCPHCKADWKRNITYQAPFLPAEVVCMKCGEHLYGRRRVSTADGRTRVWFEYRGRL